VGALNSAHVFFTFVSLLLAQLAVPFDVQFAQGRSFASPVMLVFAGLAAGQLFYLLLSARYSKILRLTHPLLLSPFLALTLLSLSYADEWAWLAALVIFSLFGVLLSRLYRMHSLKSTVRAAAAAGIVVALSFPYTAAADTLYLKGAVLVLLYCTAFFEPTPERNWYSGLASLLLFAALVKPLTPGILRTADDRLNYRPTNSSYFAPLLRTDIYRETTKNVTLIVTNGMHFAYIPNPKTRDISLAPLLRPEALKRAMVIGAAGGRGVRTMLNTGFEEIYAVDLNPNVFKAMREYGDPFVSGIYNHPKVKTVTAEGRHFIHQTREKFDLIYIDKVKLGEPIGGISPHFEDFLYTQEALEAMWEKLSPQGVLFLRENLLGRKYSLTGEFFIDELERAVRCSPKLSAAHLLIFEGRVRDNDRLDRQNSDRAIMLLSRHPLDAAGLAETELLQATTLRAHPEKVDCRHVVSDDKPFHSSLLSNARLHRWALLISLVPMLLLIPFYQRIRLSKDDGLAFAAGFTYVMWLIGITGLLFLFLENPALISPLTLFTSFAVGLLCFHLPTHKRICLALIAALVMVALPLLLYLVWNKNYYLAQTGMTSGLIVLLFMLPGFILVETPYMTVLRRSPNPIRVLAFENWGCLVAIPAGFLLKIQFGHQMVAIAAMFSSAVLCLLLLWLLPKNSR